MSTELLTSKLFIPPRRPSLVARPRLIELLNDGLHAKRRLTLVSAPAGFGKTTLVTDWLSQVAVPAAWLSLDESDNDLSRFLLYLGAAFQQLDEGIESPLGGTIPSPQSAAMEMVLTGLLNAIALRTDRLILVLDDFHLITDAGILRGMDFLLQHQPPQLHIVITTREDPDLPLARLRARDQLTEIRARDLRFRREEADTFLRSVMGLALSDQDVTALESRTEGWAAGLQLAGLSLQKQADQKSFIAEFSGSHRHILDYLTGEVLQGQPEEIRSFLLQTSILERLSGPLCDALTGQIGSDGILARLESANLFLIPLDEERRWYRYHRLFSDLLQSQLIRTQPEAIPKLHRRASLWYEAHGEIREAIDHAFQDVDLRRAASLIEQSTFPMLYQGQIAVVLSWFDKLPAEVLESAPMLCIGKAWALAFMQRGTRKAEVEPALQAASHALDRVNAKDELRNLIAGHTASIRALLLRSPAGMGEKRETLIALSREAQRLLPVEENAIRSVNDLNIGYAYLAVADLEAARPAFEQALENGVSGRNFYAAIYGPINLILSALLLGRREEALQLCEVNIDRFNRILAGQYFPPMGALYILKGSILLEHDRLAEAEQLLTDGLELIRWTGESLAHRIGYSALARARAIQADGPGMLEAVKTLTETLPKDALYAQALRHRLLLRYSPDDPSVETQAHIWLLGSKIEFGELAAISMLNPASTAQFETYLSAAHVLANLVKARRGAYSMEGVYAFLERQMQFAESHGIVSWVVAVAIVQTLLHEVEGKKDKALETLEVGLRAAAPTGLFRVFLDECEPLQPLLEALKPRLRDPSVIAYADHLLDAARSRQAAAEPESGEKPDVPLSGRELEVLQYLSQGLSYEEIGQQLFLSLNTIQSHVKHIYRKLLVNKRVHAIEKARELKLI